MNADVAVFPPARPWNPIRSASGLNDSDSGASAWSCFPSLLPHQSQAPPSENMYSSEPDPSLDSLHPESQMDFFHKLGYSTAQVCSIQQKFGPNVSTDKLLGELVKIGADREIEPLAPPVTTMSVVLPRGDVAPTLQVPLPASAPQRDRDEGGEDEDALRPVVIDGSNVAMSHGNKEVFSCLGIQLAVNFFLDRGHTNVNVFVPSWRKEQPRPDVPISDQHILLELEKQKILVFTPSRRVAGKRVVCNDDCFIVKLGYESDGIVVSNDMYRDLQGEKPEWKRFIEERLLMYSFVNNKFMPPDDPLGRHGPTLENFLRKFPKIQKKHLCPYGKKCTYGIKCKFHHPERAKQSNRLVADELREKAKNPSPLQKQPSVCPSPVPGQSLLLVEDMARKLSLGHESPSKKDHGKSEAGKSGHRSGKKSSGRKEKSGHHSSSEHGPARPAESHEQLDSGLGSIDSQPVEAPWSLCDQYQYGAPFRGCQQAPPVRAQCRPPAPCSCCSHGGPPALGSAPPFHHPHQHHGIRPMGGSDILAYPPPHYHGYGAYPPPMPAAYSHPADFQQGRVHHRQQQQRPYWSDPYGAHPPPAHHHLQGERSQWEHPQAAQPGRGEREVVRKKLLAIFGASLVDTAMDMHPQSMDPQMLVAEILRLQSQNPSMR